MVKQIVSFKEKSLQTFSNHMVSYFLHVNIEIVSVIVDLGDLISFSSPKNKHFMSGSISVLVFSKSRVQKLEIDWHSYFLGCSLQLGFPSIDCLSTNISLIMAKQMVSNQKLPCFPHATNELVPTLVNL